jgi:hypothetical protein
MVIYRGKFPNHIESLFTSKGDHIARTNDGSLYRVYPMYGKLPEVCSDISNWCPDEYVYIGQSTKRRAA